MRLLPNIVIVLVLLVAGAIAAYFIANPPRPVNPETGCLLREDAPANTIVLVDQTDEFDPNARAWVVEKIRRSASSMERYAQLTVVGLTAQPRSLAGELIHCSPGSADESQLPTGLARLGFNAERVGEIWDERFFAPIREEAERLMQDTSEDESPLLEAIDALADRPDFAPPPPDQSGPPPTRRIIIVSDMMQHSQRLSFYGQRPDWESFARTDQGDLPQLSGVDIEVHMVWRNDTRVSRRDLRTFWSSYADRTGARITFDDQPAEATMARP